MALGALSLALVLLAALLIRAQDIETTSRQRLYADPIIAFRQSAYQEIVVTQRGNDMRLYLDGGLQFSTRDEYRYTESLVYPALGAGARSVLVLGGGDGLAARELLRAPGVENIVQIELDPAVIELARSTMRSANGGSLDNPRVHIVTGDAMTWLRGRKTPSFDAVIVDLPDPDTPVLGRLYSTEFYALVSRVLAPNGLMVVQSGSPYSTQTAFWRTVSTITAGGYAVTPYHVYVPTFGDWGFALARRGDTAPHPTLPLNAATAEVPQQVGARGRNGIRSRCAAAHVGAVDTGTPAHRRRHAPRIRLVVVMPRSTLAREIARGQHAGVDLGATRDGPGRDIPG